MGKIGNIAKNLFKNHKKLTVSILAILLLFLAGVFEYQSYFGTPQQRLSSGQTYEEMPEDNFHHYIDLPIDHNDPSLGTFRGFYISSPNFKKDDKITFFLTDGQMELVDTKPDFNFFDEVIGNRSYVLIGARGHFPTLLPEVFADDENTTYQRALNLYGSEQSVEDIEAVRLDMERRGFLSSGNKIDIFGASGAGILAQQYLSKYPANVARVILQSTGAPDISKSNGWRYSPDFADFNPEGARILEEMASSRRFNMAMLSSILYQAARSSANPKQEQIKMLDSLKNGGSLWKYYFQPQYNVLLMKLLLAPPQEMAARVRYYELVGDDLSEYDSKKQKNINLLYEISADLIGDFAKKTKEGIISPKKFELQRSRFGGEVLVISGSQDVVFSEKIGEKIAKEYPKARQIVLNDGHKMAKDPDNHRKLVEAFFEHGFNSQEFEDALKLFQ